MARINLLPWREAERKRRQTEFGITLGGGLALALLICFLVHLQVEYMIDFQNQRNAYLEGEIAQLNRKIREIQELEKTKASLIARMNIIQQLQESRPEIVHLFDELVSTLPEGVVLTKIAQQGRGIALDGRAQSNARVSAYMRNIDSSDWLGSAKLNRIEQKDRTGTGMSQFSMSAQQIAKKRPDEQKEGGK